MREVKVFIASSAELKEDKQVFDLYFSEKNKLFRHKNIDFNQKTWMDFSSSINEGRLQDRYNDYIKECDIVIFLFHTKLGQYTKEELSIAYNQFLNNRKKPRIFVYFKENEIEDKKLLDFKSYCESNFGHFCDIYTSTEDLLLKFDKQIQILETEGFIKSDPVDVKRTARFVLLYICVPIIVIALSFLTFFYFTPTTCTIGLEQINPSNLPFKGAKITFLYSDRSEEAYINSLPNEVIIKEIHSKHIGSQCRIIVESMGYNTIDTITKLEKKIPLTLHRDEMHSMLFGMVKDENNRPIAEATVSIGNLKVLTDEMGSFKIKIPAELQKTQQRVVVYKKGYQLWDFTAPVSNKIPWSIILKR